MLTNEQCNRVATELWGLYLDGDGRYCEEGAMLPESSSYIFDAGGGTEFLTPENLSDEVNSWQGFGRTVEAMEKFTLCLQIHNGWVKFKPQTHIEQNRNIAPPHFLDSQKLITATHLAALEALKND